MTKLLLKNVVLDGKTRDVLIENGKFTKIAPRIMLTKPADEVIYGFGTLAVLPPFYNGHTHAAMALLRGYADDYDLFDWLSNYIWPLEAKLNEEDVYVGTRLACLEMIRSGTVLFNDMYWFQKGTIRAAAEMGMRADVGIMKLSAAAGLSSRTANDELMQGKVEIPPLVRVSMAPHAIYTVSRDQLAECADFAKRKNLPITTHLAETESEFNDCMKEHGMSPTAYLDSLGLLTDHTTLAHAVWMTDDDLRIIAKRRSVLVHNPVSNCKLASGVFRYADAKKAGCRVIIGTDGNSSNNNLSMLEEVKAAAMMAKVQSRDPKALNAEEAMKMVTVDAAKVFGIKAGIREGCDADCMLVDLENPVMIPNYHLASNLIYSADPSCIRTVICAGRVLMRDRHVPGEEEIMAQAKETVKSLLARVKK